MSDAYKQAGVDIDKGNAFVEAIKPIVKRTVIPGVIGGLGGFSGMFDLGGIYEHPVLVTATDGVGTKLEVANMYGVHDTIGIDLVAMCVNDVAVTGATPLCFLDYYATSHLDVDISTAVVEGIAEGCLQADCALIGGETAEMPGMYNKGDYDLAGFCVGAIEKKDIRTKNIVRTGDVIIGVSSSGLHSNGFSLVRKLCFSDNDFDINNNIPALSGAVLGEVLLTPTYIYVRMLKAVMNMFPIHAAIHNTGGGFYDNIPRVLPVGCNAVLNSAAWDVPLVFSFLQDIGDVSTYDMYRTFNMGIGLMLLAPKNDADGIISCIADNGFTSYVIGDIVDRDAFDSVVIL